MMNIHEINSTHENVRAFSDLGELLDYVCILDYCSLQQLL